MTKPLFDLDLDVVLAAEPPVDEFSANPEAARELDERAKATPNTRPYTVHTGIARCFPCCA
jgi:hypothetical protein